AAQIGGGTHSSQRIVLANDRNAEDGHDGVADELLDRAAVPLDRLLRGLEVTGHHAPEALAVDLLPERGRAGDVAEEDRHGLPRLPRCLGEEGRPARVAEAGLLPVLRTADRTRGHDTSLGRVRAAD